MAVLTNGYLYIGYRDENATWRANHSGDPPPQNLTQVLAVFEPDGSNTLISIYFDGVLNSRDSLPGHPKYYTPPEPVRTGRGSLGCNEWFHGVVDDVRLYNRKLNETEILNNYQNPANPVKNGLVLWLPFNEGEGTIAYDKSGYENDGSILGAQWVESSMPTPKPSLITEALIVSLFLIGIAFIITGYGLYQREK